MAQVFEFYFNPKIKPDLLFDSFCYEPENIYERRVGSLYMVGVFKNVLPRNLRFLDNLVKVIKERYYIPTLHSPEKSLKESLKSANEFLERTAKSGNVGWLGNLSFTVLSLRNFELNFTKVGDLKIYLIRGGQIIDIDKKLRFEEIEPYPLKIFCNIVSGKLAENDIVLVLTKEVLDYFQGQNLLNEIAQILPFEEKKLREILDKRRGDLSKISGICLLIFLSKEISAKKRETILPSPKEFSLKEVFSPIVNYFKNLIKKPRLPILKFPSIKFPRLKPPKLFAPRPQFAYNKNLVFILALVFFLVIGFFVSRQEEERQFKIYQNNLNQIQEKVNQAESFLILKENRPQALQNANVLLKEGWEELSPLTKIAPTLPQNLSIQIFSLENVISQNLYQLNKLVEIEEPKLLFEFTPKEFVPQKMTFFNGELYFFSPYAENLFRLNLPAQILPGKTWAGEEAKGELIKITGKFNLAAPIDDSIAFFSKPNQLTILKGREQSSSSLGEPYSDFNFNALSSFKGNLYFLDSKKGELIKYPAPISEGENFPQIWLSPQTKKALGAKSFAIDGLIWVLNKDNSISKYSASDFRETIKLDIFPEIKDFSKIFTSSALPYLYLLEPEQNRVVILNKSGGIVKQFQSEKFDNLLDFAVSKEGETIWLLNGLKVYQIRI